MNGDYWFKQKRFGMGAFPANWKGWALVVGYVILLAVTVSSSDVRAHPLATFGFSFVLSAVFIYICWRKTEGGWRWRWGGEDERR